MEPLYETQSPSLILNFMSIPASQLMIGDHNIEINEDGTYDINNIVITRITNLFGGTICIHWRTLSYFNIFDTDHEYNDTVNILRIKMLGG